VGVRENSAHQNCAVKRLRPVDLAREAGLSTQQVRNYEATGILPPAPRTESGYRTYGPEHLEALRTFRALVPGFGIGRATAIMLAVHGGDRPRALRLVDEGHAALHEQRLATDTAGAALDALAERFRDPEPGPGPVLRVGELAARLRVRPSTLRVWDAAGLLIPGRERGTAYRTYGPIEIRDAGIIAMLRRGHYGFEQIRPVLEGLRRAGSPEALRAAVAERREAHDRQSRAMLHGAALLDAYISAVE
jgi:DNA-binding transcriptional MerR regulator